MAVIYRSVYSEAMSSNRRSRNVFLAIEKPIPAVTTTVADATVAVRSVLRSPFHSGTGVGIGLFLLAGLLLILLHAEKPVQASVPLPAPESNGALAQVAESTGKLVLVPDDLYVGETTVALGFHLDFPDRAITIGYTEHFVPEGEECDSAEGGTVAFTATPARISLTACATGEGRVQLMEADTGTVIAEATATITQPDATASDAERSCHELTGVLCSPNAPTNLEALVLGQRDIAVTWDRLIGATKYKLDAGSSLGTFEVTGTGKSFVVDAGTEHTFRVQAFGNGSTWAEEWGLWSIPVTVTTEIPPTITIRRDSSPITEGQSAEFTFTADPAPSFTSILFNIDVDETGDFLTSSPTSTLRLSRNSTTASLGLRTTDDPTCENDGSVTVTMESSTEYYTYTIGSPSSATVTIRDNDCTVEFSADEYEVTEQGSAKSIFVELNGRLNKSLTIPIEIRGTGAYTVSGLSSGNLTISSGSDRASFTISAGNDTNCTDETLDLSFGNLPDGISEGSESTAEVTLEDNDNCSPELTNPIRRVTYAENGTGEVADYDATDPDADDDLTFSISGGDDSNRFNISLRTGSLTFRNPPNFETPIDRNGDNVYEIEVSVTDNGTPNRSDSVDVEVRVTNRSPTITSSDPRVSYAEGGTVPVEGYSASDPGGGAITWSLSGTDQGVFDISSGVLTFDDPPDYENPVDSNTDNVYQVTVRASDGSLTASRNVTVTATNRSPTITSGDHRVSYAEGGTDDVQRYRASDPGGGAIMWSLSGTDQGDFNISSIGELTFRISPDYEDPADDNDDNVYLVTVSASDDSSLTASRNVTVTVTDVDEAPERVTGLTGAPGGMNRGTIVLDWNVAERADNYEVAEWRRRVLLPFTYHWVVLDDSEVTIDLSNTSASVLGLEGGETYRHQVRGVRGVGSNRIEGPWSGYVETTLTLPDKVMGLTGSSGTNHGEISLSWNADGGATGYQVRQKKPLTFRPDTWIVLPDEGFGLVVNGTTAVVSNLDPDETYVYQVRGTNVHGEGDWSDDSAEIAVHDERPATPTGLVAKDIVGGRGIILEWNPVAGADEYEVERSFSGGRPTINKTSELYIGFIELIPSIEYTFKVRAYKNSTTPPLSSPRPATVNRNAPEPTHYWGHQHDHTAAYSIAKNSSGNPDIGVPAIDSVVLTAISEWNARMNYGLQICDISASNCSDMHIATIKTVAPASASDNVTGCGPSYACVTRTGREVDAPNGVGLHMTDMDVIFEDVANGCARDRPMCPPGKETTFQWTDNVALHNMPAPPSPGTSTVDHRYLYAKWVVLHELGHTLGLPDFYKDGAHSNYDPRLANEKAIMNLHWEAKTIQDTDIEQLDSIYRIHSKP